MPKVKTIDSTMPETIVLKPKVKALLDKISKELNIKPETAMTRALELLDKVINPIALLDLTLEEWFNQFKKKK